MVSITTNRGASTSSSLAHSWRYDVFLSFEGADTGNDFADHLYTNLVINGIKTFRDEGLTSGEEISQALVKTIEESKISIIIFSENYASSQRCLEELVKILECKESKKQLVWPIFYKVEPSDIGNLSGNLRWKRALTKAATLPGWHFMNKTNKAKFVHNITEEILSVQVSNRTSLNVPKTPVGIESRVKDMDNILGIKANDVRMIGIWGMGGIGKTTIAKAVYNSIAHQFEGSCFLANIRENSKSHGGLVRLQETLLFDILGGKGLEVGNVDKGINLIKKRLSHKRVLLILDDVDQFDQLNKLAGRSDWFGLGSKIIITTRDKHLLTAHGVDLIYNVPELNSEEALDLFLNSADPPRNRHLDDDFLELAKAIVDYAMGLPLAVEILGSHLCGTSINQWKHALDGYRRVPNIGLHQILMISFNALNAEEKNVFLDIACFFKGKNKNHVIQTLQGCYLDPELSIFVLIEKGLIYIDEVDQIWMHDMLEDMGKEIVRQESPIEPGKRSRLWFYDDVYRVLTENTGTECIRGIMIKLPKPDEICLSADCFSNMKGLRLFINYNARLSGDPVHNLSNNLTFVDWSNLNMSRSIKSRLADLLKDISAEWTFLLTGLCLEIFSIAFDQASSPRKPHYALYGMLLAIGAVLICICQLIHKGRREGVKLRRWGMLWWFHHPHSRYAIFGTLADFYGLIGGISQCICSIVQYVCFIRHAENPIKVSLWPAIFLICLAASRLGKKSMAANDHNE